MAGAKVKRVNVVCDRRLEKYFGVTQKALDVVKSSEMDGPRRSQALDFLDMAQRYFSDAKHFREKGNYVLAFAAVNYAHAWLDAGARIGLFKVSDDSLFAADPQ
ncbi:DUF357 domain-containing protein [Candidatus Woesearchaeota archaeon]|nr:DUF357 domain-containing protein [Candidatus Woesearchaeota archaeon]